MTPQEKRKTTIQISADFWNFIKTEKTLGESYEDTLNRLLGRTAAN